MCLDSVTTRGDGESVVGWKVVRKGDDGRYWPLYAGIDLVNQSKYGWSINDDCDEEVSANFYDDRYVPGVHIYLEWKGAKAALCAQLNPNGSFDGCALVKVEGRGLICLGRQDSTQVAVVREMRIIEEIPVDE